MVMKSQQTKLFKLKVVILNLWIMTPLESRMNFSHGWPKTIENQIFALRFITVAKYSYEVATK